MLNRLGIFILAVILLTTGALCKQSGEMPQTVTLKYWTVYDDSEALETIIGSFKAKYPYVNIDVRVLQYAEYESELLDAWVKGEGPDIFSIPNSWMGKYKQYIAPLPETVTIKEVTQQERLGKVETYVEEKKINTLSVQQLQSEFVEAVGNDAVFENPEQNGEESIYGLPLSVDTLALYYNKDLLNQAQIITAPKTWDEFVIDVKKITAVNVDGQIVRSGAALGTFDNILRPADIMSLLMMQNGTRMEQGGRVSFTNESEVQKGYLPGVEAVEFYTSFSQEDKETYSWNEEMPEALGQFVQGDLAFLIAYHYHLDEIRKQAPDLNFDFIGVPQVNPTQKINYAYYWLEGVAKNTAEPEMTWHFVEYLTSQEQAEAYLETTKEPAARKEILATQTEEYDLKPWVEQALTAKSWYHGQKPEVVDEVFSEILTTLKEPGELSTEEILSRAASKISLTYQE